MMTLPHFLLSLLFLTVTTTTSVSAQVLTTLPRSSFHPTNVQATIALLAPLTTKTTVYTLAVNEAEVGKTGEAAWIVGIPGLDQGHLTAVEGKSGKKQRVEMVKLGTKAEDDLTYYSLSLPRSKSPIQLSLAQTISHLSVPKPRSLPQTAETAFLFYSEDLLSSVASLSAEERSILQEIRVKVKIPTPRVGDITTPDGFTLEHTKGGATVTFVSKPSTLADASIEDQIATVHYQQPTPVVSIRKLERLVEVSHWGSNIAIEDGIDLFNSGPLLKGYFSRLDHQKNVRSQKGQALSINDFTLLLPARASEPYFVDIVGNVSTSKFRSPPKSNLQSIPSHLRLQPRYPIMGGWNYTFTVGYNAPLADFVRAQSVAGERRFSLKVPFFTAVPNVAVDDVTFKVRLPESAHNIVVSTPFPVDSILKPDTASDVVEKTYLDTTGRPTIILKKANCGDKHGEDIIIEYTLTAGRDYLQKPLSIAAFLAILFVSVAMVRKIDWAV